MSSSNEKAIETAFVNALKLATYIKANSIPVFGFGAEVDEKDKAFAMVKVSPLQQHPQKFDSFTAIVTLTAATQIQHDKNRAIIDAIYVDCFAVARAATASSLSTATSLQIDGIIQDNEAKSEDEVGESYHSQAVRRKIFLTLS
jgi:hypothetical protein